MYLKSRRLSVALARWLLIMTMVMSAYSAVMAAPVTITMSSWVETPQFKAIIDTFNESQSDVFIELTVLPSTDFDANMCSGARVTSFEIAKLRYMPATGLNRKIGKSKI